MLSRKLNHFFHKQGDDLCLYITAWVNRMYSVYRDFYIRLSALFTDFIIISIIITISRAVDSG